MSFNNDPYYGQQGLMMQQQQQQPPLEFFENILLAVRVIDGLFIGNAISSQDDEFLFSNKVTHIVNCAALDVPNVFSDHGVHYLSFPWRDGSVILDSQNRKISRITKFMERAFEKGECVLVHSLHGISRCCVIVCAYLMYRFEWSLQDALTFVKINHPDMDIAPNFMSQLNSYAKKGIVREAKAPESEHVLLKNTYVNSLPFDHSQTPTTFNRPSSNLSKRVQFSSKLVNKRKTPNHNPNHVKSILRIKHSEQYLREARELKRQNSQKQRVPESPPPKKRVAFAAPEEEVSTRVSSKQQKSSSSRNTSNVIHVERSPSQAIPPTEPKSPNHHRLKRADSDNQSIESSVRRNGQIISSSSSSGGGRSPAGLRDSIRDKPVLRNNFTESHTKVTQLANSPKVAFSPMEESHLSSSLGNLASNASASSGASSHRDSSNSSLRRSHTFEIVSQSSSTSKQEPEKRKRKKRSNSLDRRPLSSSFSGLSMHDARHASDDSLTSSSSSSKRDSSTSHRKRPTAARRQDSSQHSLFTQRNSSRSNHRIFQSRDVNQTSSYSSSGHGSDSLTGILTSSQLGTSKKVSSRRPRSATHRKRRPTPMHQRPQSAPNKDRSNGTMSRISSLENIYGSNRKKKKSSSDSSKKKRRSKRSSGNYSNVESRLYNPTLSFLRKTIQ